MLGFSADVLRGLAGLGEVLLHVLPVDAPLRLVFPLRNPHHGRLGVPGQGSSL